MGLITAQMWHQVAGVDRRRGRQPLNPRAALVPGTYKPGPETTGVPAGTVLTTVHPPTIGGGPELRVTEAYIAANGGRASDGRFYVRELDVYGVLSIRADRVTVQRCRVRGYANPYGSELALIEMWSGNLDPIIEDCTVDPGTNARVGQDGIAGIGYTARRNNVARTVDGFKLWGDPGRIEANYVHDLVSYADDPAQTDGSHNDGVQVQGGGQHVIRGNYMVTPLTNTAAIMVTQDAMEMVSPLTIDRNWLTGGRATLNVSEKDKGAIHLVITDNVFGGSDLDMDMIVPLTSRDVSTITGNVKTDGSPATLHR